MSLLSKWIGSMIKNEPIYINGDVETSRDFFVNNVVRTVEAVNQVYNVAVGERTTLNDLSAQLKTNVLPLYPHLQDAKPVYRDFRAGDVRHSLADISMAGNLMGNAPAQRITQGLALAMPWYIAKASLQ